MSVTTNLLDAKVAAALRAVDAARAEAAIAIARVVAFKDRSHEPGMVAEFDADLKDAWEARAKSKQVLDRALVELVIALGGTGDE